MQPSELLHTSFQGENGSNKVWRDAIIKESTTFLNIYGLNNAVHQAATKKLAGGMPIVRISHQPNLFVSLNIMGLFIWAARIAKQLNGAVVFVAIDYDEANDQRFRAALLPPVSGHNPTYLKGAVARNDRLRAAYTVPPPSQQVVASWLSTNQQALRHTAKMMTKKLKRVNATATMYEDALKSTNLTEFNLAQIARISRLLVDVPVLFISASQYLAPLQHYINGVVSDLLYSGQDSHKLAWRVCPQCYQRRTTMISKQLLAAWSCSRCDITTTEPLDWSKPASDRISKPAFVPRVLLCDLIDSRLLGSEASISYGSSATHLLLARETPTTHDVAQEAIDFLWSPQDLGFVDPTFPNANLWNRGRFGTYNYLALFDILDIRRKVLRVQPLTLTGFNAR